MVNQAITIMYCSFHPYFVVRSLRSRILCEDYEVGYCAKTTKQDIVRRLQSRILCEDYEVGYCAKTTKQDIVQSLRSRILCEDHEVGNCAKTTKQDIMRRLRSRIPLCYCPITTTTRMNASHKDPSCYSFITHTFLLH